MRNLSYYQDAMMKEFKAIVVKTGTENDRSYIVLDNTAFYPTGGGQPHDTGWIDSFEIIDVEKVDEEIRHYTYADVSNISEEISGKLNWTRRFDHMQQRTGQHILTASYERLAHLQYTPLPGGEKAVEQPWRNAVGMLLYHWSEEGKKLAMTLFPEKIEEIQMIERMITHRINSPMAGTCGRLFDAVSAILGICEQSTYDGEASMKLSDYMTKEPFHNDEKTYSFHIKKERNYPYQLDLSPMIYQIIQDKLNNISTLPIIQAFHATIVLCCVEMIKKLVEERPNLNRNVILSGGSFQNRYLATEIRRRLQLENFDVYTHQNVPCNDGGLSLGQIMIAAQVAKSSFGN